MKHLAILCLKCQLLHIHSLFIELLYKITLTIMLLHWTWAQLWLPVALRLEPNRNTVLTFTTTALVQYCLNKRLNWHFISYVVSPEIFIPQWIRHLCVIPSVNIKHSDEGGRLALSIRLHLPAEHGHTRIRRRHCGDETENNLQW